MILSSSKYAALLVLAVTLSWDPSPSPGVTGYHVYAGVDADHLAQVLSLGPVLSVSVPGVEPRCFAVTAHDDQGYESVFSNIVCSQAGALPGEILDFRFEVH